MPAAPLLSSSSCLGLAVDPYGRVAGYPVLDTADRAQTLELRDDGLYAPRLLQSRCAVRYGSGVGRSGTPDPIILSDTDQVTISFTAELVDTDSMFDPASPDRVTINTAGFYLVSASQARHISGSAGTYPRFTVDLYVGSKDQPPERLLARDYVVAPPGGFRRGASGVLPVELDAGQYVQLRVSLDVSSSDSTATDPVSGQPLTQIVVEAASLAVLAMDTE